MGTNEERKKELEDIKKQSLKNLAKTKEEDRKANIERLKEVKQKIRENFMIQREKPNYLGGQHCGMPIYPIILKSEELGVEIKIKHFRSNFQNGDLARLLMELAMDELIK